MQGLSGGQAKLKPELQSGPELPQGQG